MDARLFDFMTEEPLYLPCLYMVCIRSVSLAYTIPVRPNLTLDLHCSSSFSMSGTPSFDRMGVHLFGDIEKWNFLLSIEPSTAFPGMVNASCIPVLVVFPRREMKVRVQSSRYRVRNSFGSNQVGKRSAIYMVMICK